MTGAVCSLEFYNSTLLDGDHFAAVVSAATKCGGVLKSISALRFPKARSTHFKNRYVMPWEHGTELSGGDVGDEFLNDDVKVVSASIDFVWGTNICNAELDFGSISSDNTDRNPLALIFKAGDVKVDAATHGWDSGTEIREQLLELFKVICESTAPLYAAILVEDKLLCPSDLENTDTQIFTDFFVAPELISGLDMALLKGDGYFDPVIRWENGYFISMWLLHGRDKNKSSSEEIFIEKLIDWIKYFHSKRQSA